MAECVVSVALWLILLFCLWFHIGLIYLEWTHHLWANIAWFCVYIYVIYILSYKICTNDYFYYKYFSTNIFLFLWSWAITTDDIKKRNQGVYLLIVSTQECYTIIFRYFDPCNALWHVFIVVRLQRLNSYSTHRGFIVLYISYLSKLLMFYRPIKGLSGSMLHAFLINFRYVSWTVCIICSSTFQSHSYWGWSVRRLLLQ